jgi:hypothetical protein
MGTLILLLFCCTWVWTRTLCSLGRCSTTWSMPLTLFCFSYFSGRVLCLWSGVSSDHYPPAYTFCMAGMTGAHNHILEIGSWSQTIIPLISSSWITGIAGMSYRAQPTYSILWKNRASWDILIAAILLFDTSNLQFQGTNLPYRPPRFAWKWVISTRLTLSLDISYSLLACY